MQGQSDSGDLASSETTLAKLLVQLRENNVTILLGVLVAYQVGLLDKMLTYGSGMC
jgi:uncharacterized membrane protein YcaP (DUF421 family)